MRTTVRNWQACIHVFAMVSAGKLDPRTPHCGNTHEHVARSMMGQTFANLCEEPLLTDYTSSPVNLDIPPSSRRM